MKLATLNEGGRDGTLVVVDKNLERAVRVPTIAPTLQAALDSWSDTARHLEEAAAQIAERKDSFPLVPEALSAPLPRAYQWVDGSAYVTHVELVRKARGATMPDDFWTNPLMYQGCSDTFIGPCEPIRLASEEWGIDFEAEIAVVTDDVPMGVTPEQALGHIKLLMLVNDVSLRNLIPGELGKGFGFLQSKPASSFSPVLVTPDELGSAWKGGRVHLPLRTTLNGERFGEPDAGVDMIFSFPQLIAHAARTRHLAAGTIVGSGTISNEDRSKGSSCLAERRMLEKLEHGEPKTPFMRFGDRVRIEMLDAAGRSIFGAIDQVVERYEPPTAEPATAGA